MAPTVVEAVPLHTRRMRTVAEALQDHDWSSDIKGGLSMVGFSEYFQLWDILHETTLNQEADNHV
jgi:hypothetical protein